VNPHISLFFFSSRGTVGRPVTHRKGRGWRGGFLGSATEQYIKLDLNKWLKVLRDLELLPRPLGQDWSEIWLQHFSGRVTIWPKSVLSDFYNILSDPTPQRLARMLRGGQHSTFPKIQFINNRMKLEKVTVEGLKRGPSMGIPRVTTPLSKQSVPPTDEDRDYHPVDLQGERADKSHPERQMDENMFETVKPSTFRPADRRRNSFLEEIRRQSAIFFDDTDDTEDDNVICGEDTGTRIG